MSEKSSPKSTASTDTDLAAVEAQALAEFNSKNYAACLDGLEKLDVSPELEVKLKHNKAVAAFFNSECRNLKPFEAVLDDIVGDAHDDDASVEIKDNCCLVAFFNKAVVLFHVGMPMKALKLLLALLNHIETVDEDVAKKMCLLTANILLNSNQPKKAEAVLGLLKDRLNATFESLTAADDFDDSALLLDKESRPKIPKNLTEFRWMLRYSLLRCKVISQHPILVPAEETTEMLVLKAHQFYLGHDYQMAAKELAKKPINILPNVLKNGEEYNTVIANNMGLIHFHVRHYAMAARFFQHAITFDNDAFQTIGKEPPLHCIGALRRPEILYNLGLAMLHLQRPQDAFECFMVPIRIYQNNPKLWLRLAEACIMAHKQNAKEKDGQRNVLASVPGTGTHRKYVIRPTQSNRSSKSNGLPAEQKPTLEFANLCLRNALNLVEQYEIDFQLSQNSDETKPDMPSTSASISTSTVSSTSSMTSPSSSSSASASATGPEWVQINERQHCPPSKPLNNGTFEKLKCAVLAASSYVEITQCDFVAGLKHARELRRMSNLPDTYAMLANLYCAEALIMLDRAAEARAFLDPTYIAELKEDDFIQRSLADWKISSLDAAQSIMKYNLAVLLVLNNDLDTAKQVVATCTHPIVFNQMKILRMFIEFESGNYDNCRQLVRMDTPQYY